ncbi:AsmA family protein [Daejeonella oryzae]|uniref:AsmA family protein n=1 Tax=Daejeonella oryzae TaxID=1122943 RepID=UPI000419E3C3|nr:AsmA-like C-terminal region-containing protein [Daejeonella oryzae]
MHPWIKIALKVAGAIMAIVLIIWIGIASYVYYNKKQLLENITAQLNENLNGKLTIENMEPALIKGFPAISVSLKNVLLRDSLWEKHKHDLLKAKDVFIAIDAFTLLSGNPTIRTIRISNGSIYAFTDSNGYRNTDIFKKSKPGSKGEGSRKKINKISFQNVNLIQQSEKRKRLFDFYINDFTGKISYNSKGWKANADIDILVNSLSFNTKRGSFLKNKKFVSELDLTFNDEKQLLVVPMQTADIGPSTFEIGGKFSFDDKSPIFALDIKTKSITLKETMALVSKNISTNLRPYKLEKPLSTEANIRGLLKGGGDPQIKVFWKTENNIMTVRNEVFTNTSFNGSFTNEVDKNKGHVDVNSAISFYFMKGTWQGIPFKADSITITNLTDPILAGKFVANFPLTKLNPIFGDQTVLFKSGTAQLDLLYQAPFMRDDANERFINGTIRLKNADAVYQPRNLLFKNANANLNFKGQDLFLRNIRVTSGGSQLNMNGSIRNFLNLYYSAPEKILLDWQISSPEINLKEFLGFLGKRQVKKSSSGSLNKVSGQLDKMLDQASVHMKLAVEKMQYKKFIARSVNSELTLQQSGIKINNVSLKHAGGSLRMNGNINQTGKINKLTLNTQVINANIKELFYSFNDFGQTGIGSENLRGTLTANTNVSGSLRDNGDIVPRSIYGTIDFSLKNGAIMNFEPMIKIGAFAFKNRDFSNITFRNLHNSLNIQGNKVIIPPMRIESSVLNIFLEGVYGFRSGTNIALQIPLRNPEKDKYITDPEERERNAKKGIVINLRAQDGEDGKVKFKLGRGDD